MHSPLAAPTKKSTHSIILGSFEGWLTLLLLNTNMLVPDQEKLVTASRGQWDMNAFNLHSNNNLARKTGQKYFYFPKLQIETYGG